MKETAAPPALTGGILDEPLPCLFETSPPYVRWPMCRVSTYHLEPRSIEFLHYHVDMEIGLCLGGSGLLYLGNRTIPYHEGDVQIILPYQSHYNVAIGQPAEWHFISFLPTSLHSAHLSPDPEFLKSLLDGCRLGGVFPPDRFPALSEAMQAITALSQGSPETPFDEDCLLTELVNLMVLLSRTRDGSTDTTQVLNTETNKIMPALVAFSKGLESGNCIGIAEMAEICHFSQPYFRKLFTELMGENPKKYITREQLFRASLLLSTTNLPIKEIHRRVGFSEPSIFFRSFMRRYRMSPTDYRKKKRGDRMEGPHGSAPNPAQETS